jgi:ribose-phosphate pyrophosphokinase
MPQLDTLRLLSGSANPTLAEAIAEEMEMPLSRMTLSRFSDGEIQVKIEESMRGMDVFVIQPTCSPANETVMELLIILDALRRASAARVTCVIPYYGYGRQDKKLKPREPVTAKLVADLISHTGASRILSIDLHADQIQGFFNLPVDHLYAGPLIAGYLRSKGLVDGNVTVVSPDVGGVTRARALAEALEAELAIIAKRRPAPNQVEVQQIIGDVRDRRVVMMDDMMDTAGSITAGAAALKKMGAAEIYAACTHGILSGPAIERLAAAPIEEIIFTDTIPLAPEKRLPNMRVLSVAPLLAQAIQRIHCDHSVSAMFDNYR